MEFIRVHVNIQAFIQVHQTHYHLLKQKPGKKILKDILYHYKHLNVIMQSKKYHVYIH